MTFLLNVSMEPHCALSIDYTSKIAPRSLFKKCTHFGRKMGVATTAAPYGFWATNPTEKLAHWVYLLGQPLSRNRVFQNFSGEPPPLNAYLQHSSSEPMEHMTNFAYLCIIMHILNFLEFF